METVVMCRCEKDGTLEYVKKKRNSEKSYSGQKST